VFSLSFFIHKINFLIRKLLIPLEEEEKSKEMIHQTEVEIMLTYEQSKKIYKSIERYNKEKSM